MQQHKKFFSELNKTIALFKNVFEKHTIDPHSRIYRVFCWNISLWNQPRSWFFSNKHSASKYFSPRMIMHQENLDYEFHCKYKIGKYTHSHGKPHHKNTNAPRSLYWVYLRPLGNAQGGHTLLHLYTNKVVKRQNLTKIPITPSIIKQVHALVTLDDMLQR